MLRRDLFATSPVGTPSNGTSDNSPLGIIEEAEVETVRHTSRTALQEFRGVVEVCEVVILIPASATLS